MGIPLIGALTSLGTSLIGGGATLAAANAQAKATKYAADLQDKQYQQTQAQLQPSIDAGNTARGYQLGALGLPGGVDGATAEAAFRTSPGYDFALKTGENAAQTSAAVGGNLFSGKTLKSLSDYASGKADQQYGTWYDRLSGLSGAGNSATGTAVNAGTANANNLTDLATAAGNDRASSYIGAAGAINTGLGSLADLYLKYIKPQGSVLAGDNSIDASQYGRYGV